LPVIAATTIPTIAFMEYLVETPKYHALYFVNYDPGDQVFLHFCILLLAYVLMFLTRQNEKLRKQAEQSQQEALKANQNITKTLNEVEVTSDALNTFSQELFKNVEATNLNQNAITTSFSEIVSSINTQRNSVSEINQSMVHSNNVTSSVHESAVKLHSISQDTRMVTEKSNREVQALKDQTVTLDQVIQTSTQEMSALQEAIQKISVFLQFIMDVASQTNLLALNAAIEAARAGEHGKGFAIVAEEVRKLAESSSKATKEISQITTLIAEKSKNTADEINKISGAMHDVKQTIGTVEKTFELVLENNNTTFEQADGVQQLVAQLKDAAQRIVYEIESLSAISEQTSSNSEQIVGNLAMQEAQIQNITTSFKTLEARTNVLKDLIHQKDNQ
jgi:methyl-accepting chemotaxis protein